MKRPKPSTKKGEETRRRIFEAALASFADRGYEETTMRGVAERAETSLGLAYRYFARKDDIVLELYRNNCVEFEERVGSIPPGPLSDRFRAAMEIKIAIVAPHRAVFAAVVGATMDPRGRAFALGDAAADVRARIVGAWRRVIEGSDDAAELPTTDDLAVALFVAQLAILYYWLADESGGAARTRRLVDEIAGALHMGLGLLFLPDAADRLRTVVGLLRPLFMREK